MSKILATVLSAVIGFGLTPLARADSVLQSNGSTSIASSWRLRSLRDFPVLEAVTPIPRIIDRNRADITRGQAVPVYCQIEADGKESIGNARGRYQAGVVVVDHANDEVRSFHLESGRFPNLPSETIRRFQYEIPAEFFGEGFTNGEVSVWAHTRAVIKRKKRADSARLLCHSWAAENDYDAVSPGDVASAATLVSARRGTSVGRTAGRRALAESISRPDEATATDAHAHNARSEPVRAITVRTFGSSHFRLSPRSRLESLPRFETVLPVPSSVRPFDVEYLPVHCDVVVWTYPNWVRRAKGRYRSTLVIVDRATGEGRMLEIGRGRFRTDASGPHGLDLRIPAELFAEGFASDEISAWVSTRGYFFGKRTSEIAALDCRSGLAR